MIKLKVTREELHFLCNLNNPAVIEKTIINEIKNQRFDQLDFYFTVLELGLSISKKYLFESASKAKYKLSFKPAQAAALLTSFAALHGSSLTDEWMLFLAMKWTNEIHEQLTNYQPKYYGRS